MFISDKSMFLKFERNYRSYSNKFACFECFLGFWGLPGCLLYGVCGGWCGPIGPGPYYSYFYSCLALSGLWGGRL